MVEIGGRLRGMDADGVVFRDYKKAPPGLPRVETSIGTTSDALKEAAKVISALPEDLTLIVDHVQVTTVDQISLVLKDGRHGGLGERRRVRHQGQGARDPARHRPGRRSTTSACRPSPPPADPLSRILRVSAIPRVATTPGPGVPTVIGTERLT